MAPTIILDKSSLQQLSADQVAEAHRYFYAVIPPILLQEILCDLSLDVNGPHDPTSIVPALARKVPTTHAGALPEFRTLCYNDLLQGGVPIDHRGPVVDKAQMVHGPEGAYAVMHAEFSAVMRWRRGEYNDTDLQFADDLRKRGRASDFEAAKKTLPKLLFTARTLEELLSQIDKLLDEPIAQSEFLQWLLGYIGFDQPSCSKIFARWEQTNNKPLNQFAPYAAHCLRVHTLFFLGMGKNFVGTKPTNIIDIEYLCYLPFANVFCSGDKVQLHLAPLLKANDQSFVPRDRLRDSLEEIAAARKLEKDAVPSKDSVITELWQRHCNRPPPSETSRTLSGEESERIGEKVKPIAEAWRKRHEDGDLPPRFPKKG
jgi:hypothetical protein